MPGPAKQPNRQSELHRVVEGAPDLSASSRDKYLRDLNRWVDFAGASPSGWTRANAQAFYSGLLADGLKPQSAKRLFASLQYAARWWSTELNRPDLDFTQIRFAPSELPEKRHYIQASDAVRMLNAIDQDPFGTRDFAIIVLGLETGMRRMSLSALLAENVGADACRVEIKGSNGQLVTIPLTPTAIAAITPWRTYAKIKRGPLFRPMLPKIDSKGVNRLTIHDRRMSDDAIYVMMRDRCRTIGLKGHPHLLRHTFISWRTQQGYLPHEIAVVSKHTVDIGAMKHYIDDDALAQKMRESTPSWLKGLVEKRVYG